MSDHWKKSFYDPKTYKCFTISHHNNDDQTILRPDTVMGHRISQRVNEVKDGVRADVEKVLKWLCDCRLQ